jgi:hypothetical protein
MGDEPSHVKQLSLNHVCKICLKYMGMVSNWSVLMVRVLQVSLLICGLPSNPFLNCRLCLDISGLIQTVIKKNIFVLEANSYFKKLDFKDKKELLRKEDHRHSRPREAIFLGAIICVSRMKQKIRLETLLQSQLSDDRYHTVPFVCVLASGLEV